MSWYHFVSPDLVRWTPLTDVITPDASGAMFSRKAFLAVSSFDVRAFEH